jgi:threonine dehydrogenase-like Zn-dependent dehydrogenase
LAGVKPIQLLFMAQVQLGLWQHIRLALKASKVMVVDSHPDRLKLAEELGAIPIDFSKGSAVEQVLSYQRRGC